MKKNKIILASMVVFVVLFSMVAMFGVANAGVSPKEGRRIYDNGTAIIGETNLSFAINATAEPISSGKIEATWEGGPIISFEGPFDSRDAQQYKGLVAGRYKIVVDGETKMHVYFESPSLVIDRIIVRGRESTKVVKGENITFIVDTNLDIINTSTNITYKLVNPKGVPILIEDVPLVKGANRTTINTAQLDTGKYKVSIKSNPDTNNGLEAEGPSVSFKVEKRSITIKADVKKQAVNKDIIFDISTTLGYTNFTLNVTRGAEENVEFVELKFEQGVIKRQSLGHSISEKTDEDGIYKAITYFTKPGVYEITAKDTDATSANITATETVEIEEFSAKVSVERTKYYVGEPINITGSANAGESITVKADDEVIKEDAEVEGFSCTWRTAGKQLGSYEIGIWVLPFSDPARDPPDASVTVLLMRGGLSAKLNREVVVPGEEFEIEGIAPGMDRVDILTICPKGGSGVGFDPGSIFNLTEGKLNAPGLTYSLCGVFPDGDFRDKIRVREDADTGTYLITVLNYGRDGVWGASGSDDFINVISYNYTSQLSIKTQEQILAILKDITINAAGSDDLLCVNAIKVENPRVRLDYIENVTLGDNIVVSGYTNREEGTAITITVEGPMDFKPKIAFVEEDGTFNVSFSTVSAKIGEYTVTADDGKGYSDTKTVNILSHLHTTPPLTTGNSSENSSSTPSPAASASETLSQSQKKDVRANSTLLSKLQAETKKLPEFVVIFALIGLMVMVAVWLGLKRRRIREERGEKEK